MSLEDLRPLCALDDVGPLQPVLKTLLSGHTPTNFNYEDILALLSQYTEDTFLILPVWTFVLSDVHASARCMVQHWPVWQDEQLADPQFINQVRVMMPLFVPGSPIGHARFMFCDKYRPISMDAQADELQLWMAVVMLFIPVADIAAFILVDYQGLCPSLRMTERVTVKVIDSIPNHPHQLVEDVTQMETVFQQVLDPAWDVKTDEQRLRSARHFLEQLPSMGAGDTEELLEAFQLPSTIQTGLECIIITVLRVVATWLDPTLIPLMDCRALCQQNKGRRALVQIILHAKLGMDDLPLAPRSPASPTVTTTPPLIAVTPPPPPWCAVYEKPTMQVLSQSVSFTPRTLTFGDTTGYLVYRHCRWLRSVCNQDFLPQKTQLSLNGSGRTLFVCPVRNMYEGRWYFLLVNTDQQYRLFTCAGKNQGKKRLHVEAVDENKEEEWTPPTVDENTLEAFLTSLPDPHLKWTSNTSPQSSTPSEVSTSTLGRVIISHSFFV